MFSSCFGGRKSGHGDTEPLLPQYEQDTEMQKQLQQKLHTYQMLRALGKGFMPSTEQAIINLRTLLASDVLNPNNKDLSDSGKALVKNCRNWLKVFIELLRNKNDKDQIQDFVWYLSQSRVYVDVADIAAQAGKTQVRAQAAATYNSFKTVGSLLLTNSDFRLFLDDVSTIGKQIMSDTAFSVSRAAETTGKQLELSAEEQQKISGAGADEGTLVTKDEIQESAADTSKVMVDQSINVAKDAVASARDNLQKPQAETLLYRLKQAVLNLRKRTDYNESVSLIARLIQQYAAAYSQTAEATIATLREDTTTNYAADKTMHNLWELLSTFGDRAEWQKLEQDFNKLMEHTKSDPQFEKFMKDVGNALQAMLTDPDFFDNAIDRLEALKDESSKMASDSSFREDFDKLLGQLQTTVRTVVNDKDVSETYLATKRVYDTLSPPGALTNPDLISDTVNIFVPLMIKAIQYIPIPRVEISVPEMDLLLENLILEPGRTVNQTSFLPYRMLISTQNDLEVRKAHSKKTISKTKSLMTISVNGLSVAAQDIGFWIRGHAGLFRFADEGITSFFMDERGMDIQLDLEIARERLEQMLTLRGVRVHIHKLDYDLRKSKLSWLAWIFKPLLKQMIRRSMEKAIAENIADFLHNANRELVYFRERLRATRIADPQDLITFFKAIAARLTPEDDPDLYTRVGVDAPKRGVFKGVYAPGSIVKVWHEEALRAEEHIDDGEERGGGWRNDIFDVPTL